MNERELRIKLLEDAIASLAADKPLDEKYRDHALSDNRASFRECHILPHWLLIYRVVNTAHLVEHLGRTS